MSRSRNKRVSSTSEDLVLDGDAESKIEVNQSNVETSDKSLELHLPSLPVAIGLPVDEVDYFDDADIAACVKGKGKKKISIWQLLCKGNAHLSSLTAYKLTDADVAQLHQSLCIFRGVEIKERGYGTDNLVFLFNLLCERLREQSDALDDTEPASLSDAAQGFAAVLQRMLVTLSLVVRLFVVLMERGNNKTAPYGSAVLVTIPEELMEKTLLHIHQLFSANFSKRASNKREGGESLGPRAVSFLGVEFFPALTSLLDALRVFCAKSKPTGRGSALLLQCCWDAMGLDPSAAKVLSALEIRHHAAWVALSSAATLAVRELFAQHESSRFAVLTGLIALLHETYSARTVFQPILLDSAGAAAPLSSGDSSGGGAARISVGAFCLLCCLQSTLKEDAVADKERDGEAAMRDGYLACNSLVNEIVNRAMARESAGKEISAEYFQLLAELSTELLAAIQNPQWSVALVALESLTVAVVARLCSASSTAQNERRDVSLVNHLVDILASIAERVRGLTLCVPRRTVADCVETDNADEASADELSVARERAAEKDREDCRAVVGAVVAKLRAKWLVEPPLWMRLQPLCTHADQSSVSTPSSLTAPSAAAEDESARGPHSEDSARAGRARKGRGRGAVVSAESSVAGRAHAAEEQEQSFFAALDALLEIHNDVLDTLQECVVTHNPAVVQRMLSQGAVSVTMELLHSLHDYYNLERIFHAVAATDICFSRLLKHLVDRNGSPFFRVSQLCPGGQEQRRRDAVLSLLSHWMQAARQERRDSAVRAIAALARRLTLEDAVGASAAAALPGLLTEVRSVPAALVLQLAKIAVSNKLLLSLGVRCLEVFVGTVLRDASPVVRARGVRALSRWAAVDPELLQQDAVRDALFSVALADRAISVREETARLLGTYATAAHARFGSQCLHALRPLLCDDGVSVRKTVVAVFKGILQSQPAHADYQMLSLALLQRLVDPREEESVKDTVEATFTALWFAPPSAQSLSVLRRVCDQQASTLSSDTLAHTHQGTHRHTLAYLQRLNALIRSRQGRRSEAARAARDEALQSLHTLSSAVQLVQVVSAADCAAYAARIGGGESGACDAAEAAQDGQDDDRSGDAAGAPQWLRALLSSVLYGRADAHENDAALSLRRRDALAHCERLAGALCELLLLAEERETALLCVLSELVGRDLCAAPRSDETHCAEREGETESEDASVTLHGFTVSVLGALALLCEAHPPLAAPRLGALLPLLKRDAALSGAQCAALALPTMRILESAALRGDRERERDGALCDAALCDVATDLAHIALSQGGVNVRAALSALTQLLAQRLRRVERETESACAAQRERLRTLCERGVIAGSVWDAAQSESDLACAAERESGAARGAAVLAPLCSLAQKCFHSVRAVSSSLSLSLSPSPGQAPTLALSGGAAARLQRCLVVLGALAEFARRCASSLSLSPSLSLSAAQTKEADRLATTPLLDLPALLDQSQCAFPLVQACVFAAALHCLFSLRVTDEDERERAALLAVQVRATQALCGALSGYPRLAHTLERLGGLAALLDPVHTPQEVLLQWLRGLCALLRNEETRCERLARLSAMHESAAPGTAQRERERERERESDGESDSSLVGCVLQPHVPHLLRALLSHKETAVRLAALSLLGALWRQGLLCAPHALPHIIALQADRAAEVRAAALRLLRERDERDRALLDSRLLEGVELAFDLALSQTLLARDSESNTSAMEEEREFEIYFPREDGEPYVFGAFYAQCVATSATAVAPHTPAPSIARGASAAQRRARFLRGLALRALYTASAAQSSSLSSSSSGGAAPEDAPALRDVQSALDWTSNARALRHAARRARFLCDVLLRLPLGGAPGEDVLCVLQTAQRSVPCEWELCVRALRESLVLLGATQELSGSERDGADGGAAHSLKSEALSLDDALAAVRRFAFRPQSLWRSLSDAAACVVRLRAMESLLRGCAHWTAVYAHALPESFSTRAHNAYAQRLAIEYAHCVPPHERVAPLRSARAVHVERLLGESFLAACEAADLSQGEGEGEGEGGAERVAVFVRLLIDEHNRVAALMRAAPRDTVDKIARESVRKRRTQRSAAEPLVTGEAEVDLLDDCVRATLCGASMSSGEHDDLQSAALGEGDDEWRQWIEREIDSGALARTAVSRKRPRAKRTAPAASLPGAEAHTSAQKSRRTASKAKRRRVSKHSSDSEGDWDDGDAQSLGCPPQRFLRARSAKNVLHYNENEEGRLDEDSDN